MGENGSGKSTLIKVLAGFHVPDAGEPWRSTASQSRCPCSRRLPLVGFEFVHQELALMESLSILENLRIARSRSSERLADIPGGRCARRPRAVRPLRAGLDPRAKVGDLEPVEKALVAILRAIEAVRSRAVTADSHTRVCWSGRADGLPASHRCRAAVHVHP